MRSEMWVSGVRGYQWCTVLVYITGRISGRCTMRDVTRLHQWSVDVPELSTTQPKVSWVCQSVSEVNWFILLLGLIPTKLLKAPQCLLSFWELVTLTSQLTHGWYPNGAAYSGLHYVGRSTKAHWVTEQTILVWHTCPVWSDVCAIQKWITK